MNFAKAAGSSFVNDLGSVGQGLLAGLITNAVGDLEDDYPQFDSITDMIQDIFEIAQTGVLNNKMTIHTPAADGTIQVDLVLGGMTFTAFGTTITTTTPAVDITTATTGLTGMLTPHADAPIADADITFTGGSLAIPVGGYLLQSLGPLLFQPQFGTKDLNTTLQSLVPCEAIAQDVSDAAQGVEVLEYVVTPDLMYAACQAAVTYAATEVTNAINKLEVSGVTITNGAATLFDVSPSKPTADHIADQIGNGTWTWNFGSIGVPSTLSGQRIAP